MSKVGPTKTKWRAKALKDEAMHVILMGTALKDSVSGFECQHRIEWSHALYPEDGDQWKEADANARLIAEAGTVHHETGLTPRQLAEQRTELLEALAELLSISESDGDEWNGSGRLDDALDDARAAIAKATGKAVE